MTVGVAYVVNSTPREVSKRSIALIKPTVPTWMRSSSASPRFAKRTARYRTRLRCATTSSSRICGSRVRANSANSSRVRSRSNRSSSPPDAEVWFDFIRLRSQELRHGELRAGFGIQLVVDVIHQRADEEDPQAAHFGFAQFLRCETAARKALAAVLHRHHDLIRIDTARDEYGIAAARVLDAVRTRLGDGQLQILDVFDRELQPARDARHRQACHAHPFGAARDAKLDEVARGFGHHRSL